MPPVGLALSLELEPPFDKRTNFTNKTVQWKRNGGKYESKGKEQGTEKIKKTKKNGSMVGSKGR